MAVLDKRRKVNFHQGDCFELLKDVPDESIDLILSSPPYCMKKEYEDSDNPADFLYQHEIIAPELCRILKPGGSICWQVGMHVDDGVVTPLDYLTMQAFSGCLDLKLRNRIIWTYGHGLHCNSRFSGRHESMLWFTRGDNYKFNLDAVRIPQKYPGKLGYKGPNRGKLTGNPLGKNPSDVWDMPNVKGNHVEKTEHPCQFPIALAQRAIRALTNMGDIVFDPFSGSGSTLCAATIEKRRSLGFELSKKYFKIANSRISKAKTGGLRYRDHAITLMEPDPRSKVAINPFASGSS